MRLLISSLGVWCISVVVACNSYVFDCWLTSDFLDTTLQRSFQLALPLFVLEQFLTCLLLLILQYLYIHISYVQMTFQDSVLKLNRNKAVS